MAKTLCAAVSSHKQSVDCGAVSGLEAGTEGFGAVVSSELKILADILAEQMNLKHRQKKRETTLCVRQV